MPTIKINQLFLKSLSCFQDEIRDQFSFLDENKEKIKSTKISEYLARVEKAWLNSHNVVEHQAGFCAQWCLDNSCKNTSSKITADKSYKSCWIDKAFRGME